MIKWSLKMKLLDQVRLKMKLLDQVRHVIRKKHYSIRTEQAYTNWIKKFILFNNKRHPMGSIKNNLAFLHPNFTISLTDLHFQKSSK